MSKDEKPTKYEKVFLICINCARQKGYRVPLEGSIFQAVDKCMCCEIRTLVVDIDDLVPAWEDL